MSTNADPRLAMVAVALPTGGYRVGTGYLVTDRLVLTAGHVWWGEPGDASGIGAQIWFGGGSWQPAELRWEPSTRELDACLFELKEDHPVDGEVLWGNYDRSQPVEWYAAGFPAAAEVPQLPGQREIAEARGMLTTGGGDVQKLYEATVTHVPTQYLDWQGLSGAVVFAERRLVGLVCQALERFDGQRLWMTPIQRVLAACNLLPKRDMAIVPSGGLRSNIDLRLSDSPAALLSARYVVVPFSDAIRQGELRFLEQFCDSSALIDIALFTGAGGAGKTRLMVEYCHRRRAQDWRAGFLSDGQETLQRLLVLLRESRSPSLVTIDYAESHPQLAEELEAIIEAGKQAKTKGGAKLRIVLLARTAGDWWEYLRGRAGPANELLLGKIPFALAPVSVQGAQRQALFEQAVQCFARACKETRPLPTAPNLDHPVFERVLYLHMAALAHVEDLPLSGDKLLDGIRQHEQRFWQNYHAHENPSDDDRAELETRAARLVAAVTLRGGATNIDEAERLSSSVQGPEPAFIKFLHRRLYPGCGGNESLDAYLAPLEPDLLGEAMVAHVLGHKETPSEYLEQVFESDPTDRVRHGFIVLGRIALDWADCGTKWLHNLLDPKVPERAIPAFEAALALGEKSAFVPIGDMLADAMRREGNVALAAHFELRIPQLTVAMLELAVWATRELLGVLDSESGETSQSKRAQYLSKLGKRLNDIGQREAAFAATRDAVATYRHLAASRPDVFLPDLAACLNNLGGALAELGQREAALCATREAVQIRRQLAASRPDAFLPNLAMSLNNLGAMLSDLGQRDAALEAQREATERYHHLAESKPDVFRPNLAMSLTNLGAMLGEVGLREAALKVSYDAMRICRQLAESRPDAFLPNLAMCLNNLGNRLGEIGNRESAIEAAREAVQIRRQLAESKPDTFLPDLATSLNNLGNRLGDIGQLESAFAATREAVEICRQLTKGRPDVFLPDLAKGLNNLGNQLGKLGQRQDALDVTSEAVGIYRCLVAIRRDAFLPDLAGSLNSLGGRLSEVGRRDAAYQVTREAVSLYEQLAERRHAVFGGMLASTRENLKSLIQYSQACAPGYATATLVFPSAAQPKPKFPDTTDQEIGAVLQCIVDLLTQGKPEEALNALSQRREMTLELENARSVCHLRAGRADKALQILGNLALYPHTRRIRDALPAPLVVNYLTAALLAEGDLAYCESELQDIEDCEPARALRHAIEEWRAGVSRWQRFSRAVFGGRVTNLKLNFAPGVLLATPERCVDHVARPP